jgi:adenylyl-sulfate kinase
MSNKKHIIPHDFKVTKEDRERLNQHKAKLIWFTGISGSGKSTLASMLEHLLNGKGIHTYILDGDNVRSGLNSDLDFSDEGRVENIRRIAEVANLFVDAGLVVMASFISPFKSERDLARDLVGKDNFIEVFVDCEIETAEGRDVKGLYKKARAGVIPNFTGISSPYEKPEFADVYVNSSNQSKEESLQKVVDYLEKQLVF